MTMPDDDLAEPVIIAEVEVSSDTGTDSALVFAILALGLYALWKLITPSIRVSVAIHNHTPHEFRLIDSEHDHGRFYNRPRNVPPATYLYFGTGTRENALTGTKGSVRYQVGDATLTFTWTYPLSGDHRASAWVSKRYSKQYKIEVDVGDDKSDGTVLFRVTYDPSAPLVEPPPPSPTPMTEEPRPTSTGTHSPHQR